MLVYASAHGWAPELTFAAMKSSWALLTSTPGCWKSAGARSTRGSLPGGGRGPGSTKGVASVEARLRAIARRESLNHIVAGRDWRELEIKTWSEDRLLWCSGATVCKLPSQNANQCHHVCPANQDRAIPAPQRKGARTSAGMPVGRHPCRQQSLLHVTDWHLAVHRQPVRLFRALVSTCASKFPYIAAGYLIPGDRGKLILTYKTYIRHW